MKGETKSYVAVVNFSGGAYIWFRSSDIKKAVKGVAQQCRTDLGNYLKQNARVNVNVFEGTDIDVSVGDRGVHNSETGEQLPLIEIVRDVKVPAR